MRFVSRLARPAMLPVLVAAAVLGAGSAFAADPSANEIVQKMKAALEPSKTSVRTMSLTYDDQGVKHTFGLVQARKKLADGNRSLTVLLEPDDARGIAYLTSEPATGGGEPVEWLYMPYVARTRKLVPAENYQSFLDTNFTYGDLGLLPTDTKNKLLGTEQLDGKKTYKVESVPGSTVKQWYYARSVTWIDGESLLPVRRELYSPAGDVFKKQTFGEATTIDGVPTVLETTITDVGTGTSSTLTVKTVSYDANLPDTFFEPDGLRKIADASEWKANAGKPAK